LATDRNVNVNLYSASSQKAPLMRPRQISIERINPMRDRRRGPTQGRRHRPKTGMNELLFTTNLSPVDWNQTLSVTTV